MKPLILLYGFLIFFICLFIHIIIWRIYRPKHQIISLLIIFIVLPILIVFLGAQIRIIKYNSNLSFVDGLAIFLLCFAFSISYIMSYPACQAISPSLKIIFLIKKSMPEGMSFNELIENFEENKLIEERLEDLLKDSLVERKEDKLRLTKLGLLLVKFFILKRYLLGIPIGKG